MIFVLRNNEIKARCIESIKIADGMQVIISKPGKTSAQRSFFHMLVGIIAKHTGDSEEKEKMRIKFAILPLESINIHGVDHLFPISSEKITVEQYSQLIEQCYIRAGEEGLILPSAAMQGIEL